VILGDFGRNLAAGMTGGELFVHDPDERLPLRLNAQLVEAQPLDEVARARLRALLERHLELTGSERAAALLADWEQASQAFRVVRPRAEIARIEAEAEGTASGDPDADPAGEAVAV
jgi:glutamate synthase domain-containing protein 3